MYGAQRSRQSADEVKEDWEEVMEEIIGIKAKEESLIVLSDTNRHIGSYVKGNHQKTTPGGKLLLDLVTNGDYTLVNALDVVVNGPFTHYNSKEPDNKEKNLC